MNILALAACALALAAQPAPKPADQPHHAPHSAPDAPKTAPDKEHPVKATTPEFHEGTKDRVDLLTSRAKEGKAKLVFLGDSITEGWEGAGKDVWARHFGDKAAANFGIGGDRTEHVLWRLDHGNLDGLHPDLIVLMIGTNNTGHRQDPAADTAAGVHDILDRLEHKFPHAKVLLLAVFPRGATAADPLRKLNDQVNDIIKTYADDKRIFYRDINKVFLDDKGNLSKDIMPDLLHPNRKGYELWASAIDADIAKLMDVHQPQPK